MTSPTPLRDALFLAAALLFLSACADAPPKSSPGDARAQAILDSARTASGASVLDSARVTFNFRNARFRLRQAGGRFSYARSYRDSLGRRVEETLTNDTLRRRINSQPAALTGEARRQVETAVNSVAYFTLLPFPLGDPAVQPRYAGADTVRSVPYHRVEVTFRQQGGGRDWQDRFLYWFDQRDFSMDYLAYAYGLGAGEEPGTRFREAFNVRRVGGVRLADYRNYTARGRLPPDALERYPRLLESDSLRRVSIITLDSVSVRPLRD